MKNTRVKPKFKCYHCKKNMGSAAKSYAHFQKNPNHRTATQERAYTSNATSHDRNLPTVKRSSAKMAQRIEIRFCTTCGIKRRPMHRFCGGCGGRL